MNNLDPALVRALFDYKDGILYWRDPAPKRCTAGAVAGCLHKQLGKWQISYKDKQYLRSRLVWAWHHGEYPAKAWIRHMNEDKLDDRIENLIPSTSIESRMALGLYTAERPGVVRVGNAWHAQLAGRFLSRHTNAQAATAAFVRAYEERYGTPPPADIFAERADIVPGGVDKLRELANLRSPRPSHFSESGISAGNLGGTNAL